MGVGGWVVRTRWWGGWGVAGWAGFCLAVDRGE